MPPRGIPLSSPFPPSTPSSHILRSSLPIDQLLPSPLQNHRNANSTACIAFRAHAADDGLVTMVAPRAFALDVSQPGAAAMALDQDWHALGDALGNLGVHVVAALGLGVSITGLLRWLAVIAAIYLLVLDRTNWRTNLLTALLVPYLALQLPEPFFGWLRGEIGQWIAFIAVVIRLFFAQKFPQLINGDLELPVAFVLLIVTAPRTVVRARYTIISDIISLVIGAYLLIQHNINSGGFRRAFGEQKGILHSIGILLLFVAPAWALIKHIL